MRTDVIELSYQSKGDLERGEGMDDWGENGENGEGSSVGGRVKRSFSRTRNRGDFGEIGMDKGTSDWHGGNGQYGHRVEISRDA